MKGNDSKTPMEKAQAVVKQNTSAMATSGKAAISAFNAILDRPEVRKQIIEACSRHVSPQRMMALIRTIVSRNPRIAECTPLSVIGAMLDCTQLGLEPLPQLGHVYLVPYRNWKTKTTELQVQLGYQGMIAMAIRTGRYSFISAEVVHENDNFEMVLGSEENITHTYDLRGDDRGEVIGAWAKVVHTDGKTQVRPVTLTDIEKSRSLSKDWVRWDSEGRDPKKLPIWEEHFDAMARKTAVRRLFKFINLPIEMQAVAQADEGIEQGRVRGFSDVINASGSRGGRPLFDMPAMAEGEPEPPEFVDPESGEVMTNA